MAFTVPTYDAGSWFTEHTAEIQMVMEDVLDIYDDASPTLQILMANSTNDADVGPEGNIYTKIMHDLYDVYISNSPVIKFDAPDIDPATMATWGIKRWYTSAGTNYEEMIRYGRRNRSRIDLVKEKVDLMRKGMACKMNYSLLSGWAETLTSNEINLETELANNPVPPSMKIKGVSSNAQRIFSIPMATRAPVTGHTWGNVSTSNAFWKTSYSDGSGSTITRATTGNNIDVVTSVGSVFEDLTMDAIRTHLNKIQRGPGKELLCVMPSNLYDVLEDYLLSERRRTPSDGGKGVVADLGISASIRMDSRHCEFYTDPIMDDLWPNSMFYYSVDDLKLVFDPAFAPWVVNWERIPGGNEFACGMEYQGNLMIPDGGSRRTLSGMHGWQAPS